jgi:hypothetical protein
MENKISCEEIENIIDYKVSDKLKQIINNYDLRYKYLSEEELNKYLIHVVDVLTSPITQSGKHRINEWENGWYENFISFKDNKDFNHLIPKYHVKNKLARWKQKVINPLTSNYDYKIHASFVDAIIEKYVKNIDNIYEFGCGPAYHLLRFSELFPNVNLYGFDWTTASQKIISEINTIFNKNIKGENFDFFNPNKNINIHNNSMVLTIAALEQTGENYINFIDFLLEKKPKICINIEPMSEFLDKNNLIDFLSIDFLSIKYFEKRNYLKNYYSYLEELQAQNKIRIIDNRRIYSGSYFIEGHSLVVWEIL